MSLGCCGNCIHYFEETDFCMAMMYSVRGVRETCDRQIKWEDISDDTLLSETHVSEEITDCYPAEITFNDCMKEYMGWLKKEYPEEFGE